MGVGAIQAMLKGGLKVAGQRIVVAGSGPLLLAVAATLKAAGAIIVEICEQASIWQLLPFALGLVSTPGKIVEGIRYKAATWGVPFYSSSWPVEACGESRLQSVMISTEGKVREIPCNYLACGFHLVPNLELPVMLGCRTKDGAVSVDEWQRSSQPNIFCAGESTGIGGLELSLMEGQIAGLAAAGQTERARSFFRQREALRGFSARLANAFALRAELKTLARTDTLLCRCEDVPYGAVKQHHSWRSAKLHTRCGMGPCQGRVCGSATEFLFGWTTGAVRPPIFPVHISSLTLQDEPTLAADP
jgi:NADPH-dependent 2,4-dienoyl-CoA reductase/sulfur reductase-like enzyme